MNSGWNQPKGSVTDTLTEPINLAVLNSASESIESNKRKGIPVAEGRAPRPGDLFRTEREILANQVEVTEAVDERPTLHPWDKVRTFG